MNREEAETHLKTGEKLSMEWWWDKRWRWVCVNDEQDTHRRIGFADAWKRERWPLVTREQAAAQLKAGEKLALSRGLDDIPTWDAVRIDPNDDTDRIIGIAEDWMNHWDDEQS